MVFRSKTRNITDTRACSFWAFSSLKLRDYLWTGSGRLVELRQGILGQIIFGAGLHFGAGFHFEPALLVLGR